MSPATPAGTTRVMRAGVLMVPASRITATDWAALEAEWAAEDAALEALPAGQLEPGGGDLPDPMADCEDDSHEWEPSWLAALSGRAAGPGATAVRRPAACGVPKAGRGGRGSGEGCGFAAGGGADTLGPGPVLARLAGDAWQAGLARLSDDELVGVLRAARRLGSWAGALEYAATGDLMNRRLAEEDAGQAGVAEHADAELAAALTLTGRAASRQLDVAMMLDRLPLTSAALARGRIDLPRALVIADETSALGAGHRAAVEEYVLRRAPGQTTGQLRSSVRRAVIAADPAAARKRKEAAQRDARVERWSEDAGTAALAGRDLPPAEVLAADQNLSALARWLKATGATGTMDQLRAKAYLALLTGQPMQNLRPATSPAAPGTPATSPAAPGTPATGPRAPGAPATSPAAPGTPATGPRAPGRGASPSAPGRGASPSARATGDEGAAWPGLAAGPADAGAADAGTAMPVMGGSVNLTMPLATWLGISDAPGGAAGFGPLDASDSRTLAAALAGRQGTGWCITLTGPDGRPVAHGCITPRAPAVTQRGGSAGQRAGPPPGQRTGPAPGPTTGSAPGQRAGPAPGRGTGADPGGLPGTPSNTGELGWTFTIVPLPTGACPHTQQTPGYRVSPRLRHLLEIRRTTCSYPGCRRPAVRCDQDHTVPYDRGGITCACNLGPLCRRHHEAKQAHRWRLEQPQPGVLRWTTPHGRTYTTRPTQYPTDPDTPTDPGAPTDPDTPTGPDPGIPD